MYAKKSIEEIIAAQNNIEVLSAKDYGVKRGRPRKPREEEHRIQCACVKWFNLQYPHYRGLLFAVPNGGARSKATAGKLKAEGVVAGVSDLILLVPSYGYGGLCLEMKTPKGKQSQEQKVWQKKVKEQGYDYRVCRSLDEFMTEIKIYLD